MKGAPRRLLWIGAYLMALVPLGEAVGESCIVQRDGSRGRCRSLFDCAPAVADFRNNVRPTICSLAEQTVCCTEPPIAPGVGSGGRPSSPARSNTFGAALNPQRLDYNRRRRPGGKWISELKCDEYKNSVTEGQEAISLSLRPKSVISKVSKCVQSTTPLVIGGEEASPGEFPHMVAVGFQVSGVNGIQWDCGGTLISERFVVTAAHCTFARQYGTEPSVCRLGGHNLARREDSALDVNINRIIQHPGYNNTYKYNDIALLELERKVTFNDNIRPACLWQRADIDRPNAVAIGWGRLGNFRNRADVLMKVLLDLVEPSRCRERYQSTSKLPRGIVDDQLCAGGGKNDTCMGDSGGPLTVTSEENSCIFYLIAVTNFGKGCENRTPGVYARVSSYLSWIESEVWPDS